jgi:hypothetical protein
VRARPRAKLYDTYWRFAAKRQEIFHARLRGEPAPWSDDEVLQEFKFCNVYRASDRVSQYLIGRVIYDGVDRDPEDTMLRIVLFRLFSKEATWEALEKTTGGVSGASFDAERYARVLDELRERQSIYTAAFILCAHDAYAQPSKHRNHLQLVSHMLRDGLPARLAQARSLRAVYEALLEYPMIGPFMAYQLATDLNYSELLDFSEDDFTVPGPGAVRGLRKVFSDFGDDRPEQLIMRMVDRQEEEFDRLGLDFANLFGRRLHAIDCQGLFCEVDKYARVVFPELKSERVRIKARFRPAERLPDLVYPPKWRIAPPASTQPNAHRTTAGNDQLPRAA